MNPDIRVVYGGTFDPFHLAHEAVCNTILEQTEVTELRLIPCAQPALKDAATVPAEARLAMLKLWQSSHPQAGRIVVDDQEIRRQGVSYTSDTIARLQSEDNQGTWLFALGTDAWNSLPKWHHAVTLMETLSFWVFQRQGEALVTVHPGVQRVDDFESLIGQTSQFYVDGRVDIKLASSQLRQSGQACLRQQTPKVISDYIDSHGLYQNRS
ncbi:nicotinate (nicotinamide) nucleotide adenylyltransferase [Reinekea blandensis]|uniref:nicotinate (nicotinamide) nucleotide adenylyltransferase n=1 Tax=Reinekea blandensis TaxID=374838 RepID=UPI00031037F2|nr:nicotinate (nicotinamide) nucleotide adenylyltransferase [Reinekea blandensis]